MVERLHRRAPDRIWYVNDGRTPVGTVEQRGQLFIAITANHAILGRFPTLGGALQLLKRQRSKAIQGGDNV